MVRQTDLWVREEKGVRSWSWMINFMPIIKKYMIIIQWISWLTLTHLWKPFNNIAKIIFTRQKQNLNRSIQPFLKVIIAFQKWKVLWEEKYSKTFWKCNMRINCTNTRNMYLGYYTIYIHTKIFISRCFHLWLGTNSVEWPTYSKSSPPFVHCWYMAMATLTWVTAPEFGCQ